jgi:hypothetical protein
VSDQTAAQSSQDVATIRLVEPLDPSRVARIGIIVMGLIPGLKGSVVHGFFTGSALTGMKSAIRITRRKIPESTGTHKDVHLSGHHIKPAVDDLDDELLEIGTPFPLGVQKLDLVASSTIVVGRRSRDGIKKISVQAIIDGSLDHIVGEEHHMRACKTVIL